MSAYEKFKQLKSCVNNDGSWDGDNFVRSEDQEDEIDRLFDELEQILLDLEAEA